MIVKGVDWNSFDCYSVGPLIHCSGKFYLRDNERKCFDNKTLFVNFLYEKLINFITDKRKSRDVMFSGYVSRPFLPALTCMCAPRVVVTC